MICLPFLEGVAAALGLGASAPGADLRPCPAPQPVLPKGQPRTMNLASVQIKELITLQSFTLAVEARGSTLPLPRQDPSEGQPGRPGPAEKPSG